MKKMTAIFSIILTVLIGITILNVETVQAADENGTIVYFYSPGCLGCQSLIGGNFYLEDNENGEYDKTHQDYNEDDDYIKKIKDEGIHIIYINVDLVGEAYIIPDNVVFDGDTPTIGDLQFQFNERYEVPSEKRFTPIMYAGDQYFYDHEIIEAFDGETNELFEKAKMDLLEVNVTAGENWQNIQGFFGFLGVLGAGFLDGFNACAIALLLMFISLVGFTENKRVLIAVSITYITTMFLTYFLIGVGVLSVLEKFSQSSGLAEIVSWVIFILVSIFFIANMYDFIVSKKEEYGKVKNQLPKWIKRMNRRIMGTFAKAMNTEGEKGNLLRVIGLTFVLGLVMSLTEFLCTGQIYLGILDGVRYFKSFYGYIALFAYNLMFVLPMIVIAIFAIKSESIMGVSNWIREHLHIIKLFNALLFLAIAVFYAFRLFG